MPKESRSSGVWYSGGCIVDLWIFHDFCFWSLDHCLWLLTSCTSTATGWYCVNEISMFSLQVLRVLFIATSGTQCLDKDLSFQDWRPFFNPCSYSKFNHLSACLHTHTALILYYWTISGCCTTILFVLSRFVASLVFACFAYPIAPFPVTRGFNGQDLHFEKCLGRGYFGEASEVIESVATWQFSSILAIWTGFLK